MTGPTIRPERLLSDLRQLCSFGKYKTGVVRPAFSRADMEARHWLKGRMDAAGLDSVVDGVGNVIGYSGKQAPTLLMGSHTDTQPQGGWLDGAYGVICALEVCRALQECPDTAHLSVDVASWSDEEHTFHGFLGSKSFLGLLGPDVIKTARNAGGESLDQVLYESGLNGVPHRFDPERYQAYLEPHIEQGPGLEDNGHSLGVVTAIAGCRDYDIVFTGEANHAGSTAMGNRKDAGMALFNFAWLLNQRFRELANPFTVWTVGRVEFMPGAACVIPGETIMRLQFRDTSEERVLCLEQALYQLADVAGAADAVTVTVNRVSVTDPVAMNSTVIECLSDAAERLFPGQWQTMPSAAIHDASMFAPHTPTGMLFVPSKGGVSHSLLEDTDEEDLVKGCQLVLEAAVVILSRLSEN